MPKRRESTSSVQRLAATAIILLLAILAAAATVTRARRRAEQRTMPDEQALARTLGILHASTPEHPGVLKVLFYGQSITKSGWTDLTLAHWRRRYPNTAFVARNMALGGFGSVMLARTDARDVSEFYPDLIVFHDYGDHRAYEAIVRDLRSLTAADVILQTDHGEIMPDPVCPEGLQTTLPRPPGCAGWGWLRQRQWGDEMSYHKLPALAKRYGLALEPQRGWWRDYLLRTHIPPAALLADQIHPNAAGKQLIAELFDGYFDRLVAAWNGQTEQNVVDLTPDRLASAQPLAFTGNRVELLTSTPLAAPPAALIDGHPATEMDGCYQVSRTSDTAVEPDWPALRRITLHVNHQPADWTADITEIGPDASHFRFVVRSSAAGEQGSGTSERPFTATNGQLSFEPDDWMLARAVAEKHLPIPAPFQVRWTVRFVCGNEPLVTPLPNHTTEYRYTLATGLPNSSHQLFLRLAPVDRASMTDLRIYHHSLPLP